jgi:ribosomal protein L27
VPTSAGAHDTLFATAPGVVRFGAHRGRKIVSVLPEEGSTAV